MAIDPSQIVLVCPDNDLESRTILRLAYKLGMHVIRSMQNKGATLQKEPGGVVDLINATQAEHVWIVEIPGVEIEEQLRANGLNVVVIDHHDYGMLLRSRASDGSRLPSSLEQFLQLAGIDDELMVQWGLNPRIVRGIGILDALFVRGLREADYSQGVINIILDLSARYARARAVTSEYGIEGWDRQQSVGKDAWKNRELVDGVIVVTSDSDIPIRGVVSYLSIYDGLDEHPMAISSCGGSRVYLLNVEPETADKVRHHFADARSYTFGSGRCVGLDNNWRGTHYTPRDLIAIARDWPPSL